MRIFLAVFPPPAVQEAAFRTVERLRRSDDGVSWVKRDNLHYTLRFMGELGAGGVTRVLDAARRTVEGRPPFTATLGEAGAFPNARRARVLWLGLSEGADPLLGLARTLERVLRAQGFDSAERPFTPHLTLGRVRRGGGDWEARLAALTADPAHAWDASFTVDRIRVVQSTLSPGGSIFQVRAEAALVA